MISDSSIGFPVVSFPVVSFTVVEITELGRAECVPSLDFITLVMIVRVAIPSEDSLWISWFSRKMQR